MSSTPLSFIHRSFLGLALVVCMLAGGCRETPETIWKSEVRSPHGDWIARAETDQRSGFGTDGAVTAVWLQPVTKGRLPVQILSFSQNQNSQTSLIQLELKWTDETHLEVSYKQHPNVDFQAVRYAGIEISTQDLSDQANSSPK